MRWPTITRIRIWSSAGTVDRNQFLFSRKIFHIGSDRRAEVRLKDLNGFELRFDLSPLTYEVLGTSRTTSFSWNEVIHHGPYYFQLKQVQLKKPLLLILYLLIGIGAISLWTNVVSFERPQCDRATLKEYRRQLQSTQSDFEEALSRADYTRALAEVLAMKQWDSRITIVKECTIQPLFERMEVTLFRAVVQSNLDQGKIDEAIEVFDKLKEKGAASKLLEKRIRLALRDLYLEGYREEENQPMIALEKMERAHDLCQKLTRDSACFRTSSSK